MITRYPVLAIGAGIALFSVGIAILTIGAAAMTDDTSNDPTPTLKACVAGIIVGLGLCVVSYFIKK